MKGKFIESDKWMKHDNSVNLNIPHLSCVLLALWKHPVLLHKRPHVRTILLFINIFVTKFNGFSKKIFRENSNILSFWIVSLNDYLLALIQQAPLFTVKSAGIYFHVLIAQLTCGIEIGRNISEAKEWFFPHAYLISPKSRTNEIDIEFWILTFIE